MPVLSLHKCHTILFRLTILLFYHITLDTGIYSNLSDSGKEKNGKKRLLE